MLIVRTYVAPSSIHGLGVFVSEPLKKGTPVWIFNPVIDQEITAKELAALPDAVRDIVLSRSFVTEDGSTILSRDNGVFLNHSENPTISDDADGSVALRDLAEGEELTEDYRLLSPGACRAFLDCFSSHEPFFPSKRTSWAVNLCHAEQPILVGRRGSSSIPSS
jgi:uncharacterized protein